MDQILKDDRFEQGLARLQFIATQGTMALITGQTGVDKSTLIKVFKFPQQVLGSIYPSDSHKNDRLFKSHRLLDSESLTDLRLLASSALDDQPPFKLLLAGQESLINQLKGSRHVDLLQRITLRYQLPCFWQARNL